jgi:ribosomal protein S18 acetylase RimI-like enzyme
MNELLKSRLVKPLRRRSRRVVDVEVREMQLADIPAVFELGSKLFTAERWPTLYRSWDEHELTQLFTTDGETCLVAIAEEQVVGFALGRLLEKPRSAWRYGWLLWLGVQPAFKRHRVATRLVRYLTGLFIEKDARIMLVDTDEENAVALRFFRKQGFGQEVGHVYLSLNLENHPKYIERREARLGPEDWDV